MDELIDKEILDMLWELGEVTGDPFVHLSLFSDSSGFISYYTEDYSFYNISELRELLKEHIKKWRVF